MTIRRGFGRHKRRPLGQVPFSWIAYVLIHRVNLSDELIKVLVAELYGRLECVPGHGGLGHWLRPLSDDCR
jgi:hypothetical protein